MAKVGIILFLIGFIGAALLYTDFARFIPLLQSIPMDFRAYLICAAVGAGLFFWGRRPGD